MENNKNVSHNLNNKFNRFKIKFNLLLIIELIKSWNLKINSFHSMNKWQDKYLKILQIVSFKNSKVLSIQTCKE